MTNWKNISVFGFCLIIVWLIGAANLKQVAGNEVAHKDYISIDCGANAEYVDETTGIWYQTDEKFVKSGTNYDISPGSKSSSPFYGRQVNRLRSFLEGERNCYTLKVEKNHKYLIRTFFVYGDYDNKNEVPVFDLYLGVNYWATIRVPNVTIGKYYEIIQKVATDIIQVCLVNTGQGTPFINILEARPLNNSLYPASLSLSPQIRVDVGSELPRTLIRYKDDVYDRFWVIDNVKDFLSNASNTMKEITAEDSAYKLPQEILRTAVQALNHSNVLHINFSYDVSYQHYVVLHFAEIQSLPSSRKRIINVTIGKDESFSQPLEFLKPITIISKKPTQGYATFTLKATAESDASPILNAFEIHTLIPQPNSPTNGQDVNAIMEIKRTYGLSIINWQGDPCVPSNLAWDGLNCNSDKNPRIISLNLSSSNLMGQIIPSFVNLEKLEVLDLSNNELTGQLPEFLADLPNLKFLNLAGNKLEGSIPTALREKANLQLSVANNPGLCQTNPCKKRKFVIPLISSVAVLVITVIVSLMIWRLRKKRLDLYTKSQKTGVLKQMSQAFSYSQVLRITNNFEAIIGEGGFGKVYLGTLDDGTQVAVKFLSTSSKQGYKEFHSEVQLLAIARHRNLVSLVGYCHQDHVKVLIYEYMDNGNLSQLLSEKNTNVLKWNERLQVAVDAAKGLDYLHNGCSTPIIHRDLKPSNILLNKFMVVKIADFGLSRAFTNDIDTHLSTQPAGTPGYIDPEFQRSGNLNKKSDIYSFGMILLQLITGQPPIKREPENISFILDWVRPKIECGDIQGIVDPKFAGEFNVNSVEKALEMAMSCVLPDSTQRPDISEVYLELKSCLALEMDHATDRSTPSSSLSYTGNYDSTTTLSGT